MDIQDTEEVTGEAAERQAIDDPMTRHEMTSESAGDNAANRNDRI